MAFIYSRVRREQSITLCRPADHNKNSRTADTRAMRSWGMGNGVLYLGTGVIKVGNRDAQNWGTGPLNMRIWLQNIGEHGYSTWNTDDQHRELTIRAGRDVVIERYILCAPRIEPHSTIP
jgi:hypothetical protein